MVSPESQQRATSTVGTVCVGLLYAAHHLTTFRVNVAGLPLAPYDVAGLIIVALWIAVARCRFVLRSYFLLALLPLLLVEFVSLIAVVWSPAPDAAQLPLSLFRLLILFVALSGLLRGKATLQSINSTVFVIGATFSFIALVMYATDKAELTNFAAVSLVTELRLGLMIHVNDIRLTGFAHDPNFFCLWLTPALVCGLVAPKASILRYFGIVVIGLAMLLTASRSALALFAATTLVTWLTVAVAPRRWSRMASYFKTLLLGVLVGLPVMLAWVYQYGSPTETIARRMEYGGETRLGPLERIVDEFSAEQVLVGAGPRAIKDKLGYYSHNSYVEILVELGLLGLMCWLLFTGSVFLRAMSLIHVPTLTPWAQMWLVSLGAMLAFSLIGSPMLALVSALLVAQYEPSRDTEDTQVLKQEGGPEALATTR